MENLVDSVDEDHAFFLVDFDEADLDDFRVAGLNGAADVLRFDWHFAVAAVDQHAERDTLGAAEVEEAVHGGTDGAAGVKDVVHEDEVHAVHTEGDVRRLQHGLWRDLGEVIAIKGDVQSPDRDVNSVDPAHGTGDPLSQRYAPAADADQGQALSAATFFDDLVGQALQGAVDFGRGH